MRKRQTMFLGVVAVLLLVSVTGIGCGSGGGSEQDTPYIHEGSLRSVCGGDVVPEAAAYTQTSGIHPLIVARHKGAKWQEGTAQYTPPPEWRRQNRELAEVELVVCVEEEEIEVEKCSYTLTGGTKATVSRVQRKAIVTLREAQTGEVVATSKAMKGGPPPQCKDSEQFSAGTTFKTVGGSRPEDEVNAWLEQYVEIP